MPKGVITALEVQKRNKERINVYLDGEFAFGLTALEAARLKTGQVLTPSEIAALKGEDAIQQAMDSAGNFLSFRPRSEAEVRRNLKEKDIAPEVIEEVIDRLRTRGYLDDAGFARFWTQNRSTFKPLSRRALRQELRDKGVADSVIQETLEDVDESSLAEQAARAQLRKWRGLAKRDFKQKLAAYLARRGFSYDTTQDVAARLIDELEESDPIYFSAHADIDEDLS
jgi:regulatory protein